MRMRSTTLINKCLGLQGLWTSKVQIVAGTIEIFCRKRSKKAFCPKCGRRMRNLYDCHVRSWRHLPLFTMPTNLSVEIRRVNCPTCGVLVESVPWARHGSRFTKPFEDAVAWLLKYTNKTAVCRWFGISWLTVGNIAERVVAEQLDETRFDNLEAIGVDEFHVGKGHVLTLVVDHKRGKFIWAKEGQSAETLGAFFKMLGPERRKNIKLVSMDMDAAYKKAVKEWLPDAQVVFDPFHVTRLVIDALDEVRREEMRRSRRPEKQTFKGYTYALRKNPWNLTVDQAESLKELARENNRIYRAYLLKESLLKVYDYVSPVVAADCLKKAMGWAARSRLKPFLKVSRTIRKHFNGVLAFVRHGISNGVLESTCRHMRLLNSRAYGFASAGALIAMTFLYRGGVNVLLPFAHT